MISVIAASLLTATVVFTGCGGGGSTVTTVGGTSSSTASSSSAPSVKLVRVSDGYVLDATVKCKTGDNEPVAVATNHPGEYEFSMAECPANLCAKDGYIDVNNDGMLNQGEPKAPTMTAPGSYSNINPFTTLIVQGMTPAEVAQAFGLETTNFDIAIPEASDVVRKKAIELSIFLAYLESKQQATTKACLPGQDCGDTTTEITSLADLVAALKSGKTFEEVVPADIMPTIEEIESAPTADEAEMKAAKVLAELNGCYECEATSSSEESSSSEATSSSETNTSSSEATSSSEENATSSECEEIPGQPCSSSSETNTSSSEATSSSEESSSSVAPLPGLGDEESSSSEATSSSETNTSSSEATSSSEENASSSVEALPTL